VWGLLRHRKEDRDHGVPGGKGEVGVPAALVAQVKERTAPGNGKNMNRLAKTVKNLPGNLECEEEEIPLLNANYYQETDIICGNLSRGSEERSARVTRSIPTSSSIKRFLGAGGERGGGYCPK